MKFKWDKKYLNWGVTAFLVIAAAIVFYLLVSNSDGDSNIFGTIIGAIGPVLLGFAFAYILNPLLNLLEFDVFKKWGMKLFKKSPEKKAKTFSRALGLLLTVIAVLAAIGLLLWMIIPRLVDSFGDLVSSMSTYYQNFKTTIFNIFPKDSIIGNFINSVIGGATGIVSNFLKNNVTSIGTYAGAAFESVVSVVAAFFDGIVALIIAVYVLAEKEKFSAQAKKLLYGLFKTERATNIIQKSKRVDKIFTGFISGKIIDSFIIGILCYIILSIFNIPYKEIVSVFVGVTNVIPFFGPFIGAIPSAFIILLASPIDALYFIIIIIVIQQLDGNIIGPKILGESTGLSGFWVLCSLLVFGSLFGFVGMLVGVPTFAAIYAAVKDIISEKLEKKEITSSTDDFKKIDYIDSENNKPVMKSKEQRTKTTGADSRVKKLVEKVKEKKNSQSNK